MQPEPCPKKRNTRPDTEQDDWPPIYCATLCQCLAANRYRTRASPMEGGGRPPTFHSLSVSGSMAGQRTLTKLHSDIITEHLPPACGPGGPRADSGTYTNSYVDPHGGAGWGGAPDGGRCVRPPTPVPGGDGPCCIWCWSTVRTTHTDSTRYSPCATPTASRAREDRPVFAVHEHEIGI